LRYKSGQVAQLYNVTRETLRNWSDTFREYLNEDAQPGTGKDRIYTPDDLKIISLVAELRNDNLSLPEIHAALRNGQRGEPPALSPDELDELLKTKEENPDTQELTSALVRATNALKLAEQQLEELENLRVEIATLKTTIEHQTSERTRLEKEIVGLQEEVRQLSKDAGHQYAKGYIDGLKSDNQHSTTKPDS
jgi:DNA-binding transcriptional MerR regulator